jgi:hypothetical protein
MPGQKCPSFGADFTGNKPGVVICSCSSVGRPFGGKRDHLMRPREKYAYNLAEVAECLACLKNGKKSSEKSQ